MSAKVPATPGRFVWHDLMSTDPEASKTFYTDLLGWTTSEMDMGEMGKYTFWQVGEAQIGGMVPLDAAQGAPPHWYSYVTVDDVDAACERATSQGGSIRVPPTDIPDIGRFAVLADPNGAVFATFTFAGDAPPEPAGPPGAGHVAWLELLTSDTAGSKTFYESICGWSAHDLDMGPTGTYTMFKTGDAERAGMMQMPPEAGAPPYWMMYVTVDDVDAVAAKVLDLGGKQWVAPKDIPGVGRFSVVADPSGVTFGLFKG